jgi:mRNA-degrading endonuclease RelE of RelBE toxin-antitoxin system
MSLTVVLWETALRNLARLRAEDRDAFTQVRSAITALADHPRPGAAVTWGTAGIYRLHAGSTRILHEVDDQAAAVYIINIGIIS